MQLSQLEALLAVMEHGSFLAAARALDLRRATLQKQIDTLEAEVGTELLVRSSRGAEATRAGQAFAQRARSLLAEAETLRGFLDQGSPVQHLRLALQPGLPPNLFVFMAQVLGVRLPDVRVEFRMCSPEEAIDDPDIDLIGQFSDTLPRGEHRTFVNHHYPIRLLASPGYLDARGRPSSVEDLADHDLLGWTGFRPERSSLWPRLDGTSFRVTTKVVSNDTHVVRTLANAGLGIALVADAPQVQGTLLGDELERVLDDVVGEEGQSRLLIPERAAESPAVRAFVQLAREFGLEEHDLPTLRG